MIAILKVHNYRLSNNNTSIVLRPVKRICYLINIDVTCAK